MLGWVATPVSHVTVATRRLLCACRRHLWHSKLTVPCAYCSHRFNVFLQMVKVVQDVQQKMQLEGPKEAFFKVRSTRPRLSRAVGCPWCSGRVVPGLSVGCFCRVVALTIVWMARRVQQDPRLVMRCLHCKQPHRLNPFVLDNPLGLK